MKQRITTFGAKYQYIFYKIHIMKKLNLIISAAMLSLSTSVVKAQAPTGADYMQAFKKANCTITFDVNAEGEPFRVKWGMDTAWNWNYNVYRGIAHMGDTPFETGRISFQPNDLVTDNGDGTYTLSQRQRNALLSRINNIKLTGTKEVNINCDHEMLFKNSNGQDDFTGRTNYQGKPEEWYKLIKASVQYTQKQGLKVVSVSPFNEADFTNWNQYKGTESNGMKDFLAIAKLIKADPFFDGIRVCGGNTLNSDRALPWYNYLKEYIDEGNTHQLAGSFKTYADFFATVKADGKVGSADELHNVGEAIVGANYGMTNGIWWGYDSKARGQFMIDSNEGVRLGYGENRSQWTDGAVYRNERTGEVHGYFGSSERQANNSSISYVSTSRDVFFNGYGPTRMFVYDIPGGTGYQNGQINAERLFDITWGEDVAPGVIDGTYQIMNANNKYLLTMNGSGDITCKSRVTSGTTQQWKVYPIYKEGKPANGADGDVSYWCMDNAGLANSHLNSVLDWGKIKEIFTTGTRVITYSNNSHPMEEQWYLKYAKDGYFFIVNRLTNKYLYCAGTSSGALINSKPAPTASTAPADLKKYMWRFMPTNAKAEIIAPDAPTNLIAKQRTASIELTWNASTATDVASYTVIRGEVIGEADDSTKTIEWNTIGRNIEGTTFHDNTALPGHEYSYKVKAVDLSGNRSDDSEIIEAQTLNEKAMLCQIQFDDTLSDNTANRIDAKAYGNFTYSSTTTMYKSGTKSLSMNGSQYALIPNGVAAQEEMTIAMWVRWGTKSNWQRIFDFGSGENKYMFFTPSNGSQMRFVMKNGGEEEILTTGKSFASLSWHHLAITIKPIENGKVQAILYIDGVNSAETNDFTILPSDIKPGLCYIGRSQFDGDPLFNGRLDDFRIYNYALTAEEIATVMEDLESVSKDVVDSFVETTPTSIKGIETNHNGSAVYDLSGRKISNTAKGIVIDNGKKIMK